MADSENPENSDDLQPYEAGEESAIQDEATREREPKPTTALGTPVVSREQFRNVFGRKGRKQSFGSLRNRSSRSGQNPPSMSRRRFNKNAGVGALIAVGAAGGGATWIALAIFDSSNRVLLGSNTNRVFDLFSRFHSHSDPLEVIEQAKAVSESLPGSETGFVSDNNFFTADWEQRWYLANLQPDDARARYPLSFVTTYQNMLDADPSCSASGGGFFSPFFNKDLELGLVSFALGYVPLSGATPLDPKMSGEFEDDGLRGTWWAENDGGRMHLWISHESPDLSPSHLFARVREVLLSNEDLGRPGCGLVDVIEDQLRDSARRDSEDDSKINISPIGRNFPLGTVNSLESAPAPRRSR